MFRATKNRIPSVQGGEVKEPAGDDMKIESAYGMSCCERSKTCRLTSVSPKLAEPSDFLESNRGVHGDGCVLLDLSVREEIGQPGEQGRVRVTRVDSEGQDGSRLSGAVGVDKVHLGLGSVSLDRVIGRGVDVPSG